MFGEERKINNGGRERERLEIERGAQVKKKE